MSVSVTKQGIVYADGSNINENMCTWGYSRHPYFPNTAGNTVLSITDMTDFMRYTPTTVGSDGGKYGYPCGSGNLVQGTVYTWSCEVRAKTAFSGSGNSKCRFGFEGGGVLSGAEVSITTDWTLLTKTWTQTTSQAFIMYPAGSLADGNYIDIRNLKCEVGSVATPYVAPSNETANYVGTTHGFNELCAPAHFGNGDVRAIEFIEW